MTGITQPIAPAATPATILPKTPVNAKQKPAIAPIPAKKIQRLNGAKFVVTNNCEKVRICYYFVSRRDFEDHILKIRPLFGYSRLK